MSIKQYEVGKSWEEELMDYYGKRGFYTYKFPTDFNGTICDIFISKNGGCMYIEAKHTKTNKLYYKGCGIYKKRDEIDNFVKKYNNNIYIMFTDKIINCFRVCNIQFFVPCEYVIIFICSSMIRYSIALFFNNSLQFFA